MRATILTIGDEILIGQVTDTNATYMAAALSEEGITVIEHLSVADSRMGIMSGLDRALEQSDLVLMTGGLGPTKDDITKLVLSDYFGAELRLHAPTWARLQKVFSRYGRKATEAHKEQCRLPTNAKILVNERGTAPGLWLEKDDQVVISMPGVPYEMQYLMDHEVMRRLKRRQFDAEVLRSITILTAGEGESTIAELLETLEDNLPEHMSLAYLPSLGTVRLRISARGEDEESLRNDLEAYRQEFEQVLGPLVYGYGKDDLASVVARTLQERKQFLATAESCTGGYLGGLITALPGSSNHYRGGVVAYSNDLKTSLLGVPEEMIAEFGAVSQETVAAMAEGARTRLGADYALATSGIAGPSGGTPQKPVGTIWIGLATPEGTVTKLLRSGKDRQRNIEYTALHALNLLRLEIGAPVLRPVPEPVAQQVEEMPKEREPNPRAVEAEPNRSAPKTAKPAKSRRGNRNKPASTGTDQATPATNESDDRATSIKAADPDHRPDTPATTESEKKNTPKKAAKSRRAKPKKAADTSDSQATPRTTEANTKAPLKKAADTSEGQHNPATNASDKQAPPKKAAKSRRAKPKKVADTSERKETSATTESEKKETIKQVAKSRRALPKKAANTSEGQDNPVTNESDKQAPPKKAAKSGRAKPKKAADTTKSQEPPMSSEAAKDLTLQPTAKPKRTTRGTRNLKPQEPEAQAPAKPKRTANKSLKADTPPADSEAAAKPKRTPRRKK
ncbi:PncC family amidohydrolase [Neolewinella xylanilytica]|uniref:CinA-like protein n=1 Tax=Neolewinella xylanilytica TaxID=1514080 RepID=A0A2S6I8S5_9BACT|nr:competence/damage-inducible protein A [Neolewinella xylanilytica]PPK87907.1 PncC family amidohydrolase [Neolewinella xylanilytica]